MSGTPDPIPLMDHSDILQRSIEIRQTQSHSDAICSLACCLDTPWHTSTFKISELRRSLQPRPEIRPTANPTCFLVNVIRRKLKGILMILITHSSVTNLHATVCKRSTPSRQQAQLPSRVACFLLAQVIETQHELAMSSTANLMRQFGGAYLSTLNLDASGSYKHRPPSLHSIASHLCDSSLRSSWS